MRIHLSAATIVAVGAAGLALGASSANALQAPATSAIPPAVTDTWSKLVGTWVTDNAAYRSEAEPIDQYGIEWRHGLGRLSLVGRLYGLREGREIGTFWEFREFWHPGDKRLLLTQFGAGGAYGEGPHDIRADGTSEMLQTFFDPAGGVSRVGHRSELTGDVHVTRSFDVGADGTWTPRRTYTWTRQPARGQAVN